MRYGRHSSGLYLPQPGFGAFGATVGSEFVPDKTVWPKSSDAAAGLIHAVGNTADLTSTSFDQGGTVNPPIMNQIGALRATLESTTGLSLGQLTSLAGNIAALTQATSPVQVVSAVDELVKNAIEIVVSTAEAAGAAAEAVSAVPILGAFIGGVLKLLAAVFESAEAYKQAGYDCQKRADNERQLFCNQLAYNARITATEEGSPQPSDQFRPVLYATQGLNGGRLPLTPASIYVMLCGGETQGAFGKYGPSRGGWLQAVELYKKRSGNKRIGIPQSLQRKMWALIKGVLGGVNPPYLGAAIMGDNGRAIMPVLQDIVWNLYRVGDRSPAQLPSRGDNFGIDYGFVRVMSDQIGVSYFTDIECRDLVTGEIGSGAVPEGSSSCKPFINLADGFVNSLKGYESALVRSGLLGKDKKTWNLRPRVLTSEARKKAYLVIRGPALKQLTSTVTATRIAVNLSKAEKRDNNRKAAIATTSVVLGAGAFWAARRRAKMTR